ncbi:MAG: GpE family phage tail protein [Pseudomonadota bacterium]|jgi:hypothetical protein
MPFGSAWIAPAELWRGAGVLARWFRFQPSEIDALALDDFVRWCRLAAEQIKAEGAAAR